MVFSTLEGGVDDFAHYEDGVGVSFYDRKEEWPIDGELQRNTIFLDLVMNFGSFR